MHNTFLKDILTTFFRILPILCFLNISSTSLAQPIKDWDKGFGGEGYDDCNAAIQTSDLGYLLGGVTTSDVSGDITQATSDDLSLPWWFQNVRGDYWVLRTDENGDKLWEARFGGNKEDRLWGLEQTVEGGYILGGVSYSDAQGARTDTSRGHADYWIIKIDDLGNKEWDRAYGGDSTDILNVIIQTQDGGFMLGGWSLSSGWTASDSTGEKSDTLRGDYDWWIVKTDPMGIIEWERSYGGNDTEQLADIVQKEDGTYLIAGGTDSTISGEVDSMSRGSRDFWLLHIDSDGNKLREYRYGGQDFDDLNRVIVTSDSGYVLAGSSYTMNPSGDKTEPGFGIFDWWVLKIDTAGVIQWQHTFGGSDIENIYSLTQNTVDHYMLGGYSRSIDGTLSDNPTKGNNDYWIMYLDPDGNVLWDERYGGDESESMEQLFQTDDGGYLLAGHSRTDVNQDKTDPSNGANDFWIVKTLCNISVELNDTIVCPGDSILISAFDPNCVDCVYTWSDDASITDSVRLISTLTDLTYTVTLTDGVGCQRSDEINITVASAPSVDLGSDTGLCEGSTLGLDAGTDGTEFLWSTGDTIQTISVDTAATYSVTVTNANNCVVEDSILISINPLPIVDLGVDTALCNGSTYVLNAGNPGASYEWSMGGGSNQTVVANSSGVYSVTVTDINNCSSEDVVSLSFDAWPQPVNLASLAPGPHCPGTVFDISILNSEPGVLYELFDGNNISSASEIGTGGVISIATDTVFVTTSFNIVATLAGLCSDTLSASTVANIGDIEAPTITCRTDTIMNIEGGNCDPVLSIAAPVMIADNCGIKSVLYTLTGATNIASPLAGINDASGLPFNVGLTTVLYTAIDSFDNSASCNFDVEVIDLTQPLVSTPAVNEIVECDGAGNTVAFNNWLNNNGGATAFDVCSALTWSTIPVNPILSDDCGETGTVTVTFVATDSSGNSVFTEASFTIQDTQAPTFTVPSDITIGPNDDPVDLVLTGDVIDEADNCDGGVDNLGPRSAEFSDVVSVSNCSDVIVRTWTLIDECGNMTEQSQVITQEFTPPSAFLTGDTEICSGELVEITFNLSGGTDVYNVVYTDNDFNYSLNGIADGDIVELMPTESTIYSILSIVDASRPDCEGTIGSTAEVIVNQAPEGINVIETCDVLSTEYIVTFEITGGNPGTYTITGDGGLLSGNEFTSFSIPKDSSYLFYIDDSNGCGPVEVSGSFNCQCITETGTIQETELLACGGETITTTLQGMVLDENDILEFIVHDGDANNIGTTIFYTTNTPAFNLQSGMIHGVTYFVTVVASTDDGNGNVTNIDACYSESIGVPIVFHEPPIAVITPMTDTELDCIETSLFLNGNNSQTQGGINFEWSINGQGNIISGTSTDLIEIDEAGDYVLIITDLGTACTASTSMIISANETLPIAVIAEPSPLTCNDMTVQLDATGSSTGTDFTYQWTGGLIENGGQSLTPTVSLSGMYTLEVIDAANGCTNTAQIFVASDTDPPLVTVMANDLLDCIQTEITLNGDYNAPTNNVSIQWFANPGNISSGENTLTPSIDASGTYVLEVTNLENGCTGEAMVMITADQNPPEHAELMTINPECFGDENGVISVFNITGGTAPFTYSIDGEHFYATDQFANLSAGIYTVAIQDANGCEWGTSVELQMPPELVVDLGANITLDLGDSIQLNALVNQAIDTFIWNFPELLTLSPFVRPIDQTSYLIQVTNSSGCEAEDYLTIIVRKDRNVFIPNTFSPNDDGFNDYFSIFSDQSVININTFQVFDRWGELVFRTENILPNIPNQGWDGKFKGQYLQQAVFVYYAEIEFIDGRVEIFKGDLTLLR